METGICIYCGRTLALQELLEKGGTYRCRDEEDCLAYQSGGDAVGDDPEALADLVRSCLSEAEERLVAYRGEPAGGDEALAVFDGMKAALDAFAEAYRGKEAFRFQSEDGGGYGVAFQAGEGREGFTISVAPQTGSRYGLIVAAGASTAVSEGLYRQFIYKSYPESRMEDLLQDLAVVLLALDAAEGERAVLLERFRREIEPRSYRKNDL